MKTVVIDTADEGQVRLYWQGAADDRAIQADIRTIACEGGRGRKLRMAFGYAFGEMNADAVITLPASGKWTSEDMESILRALEEGASVAVCDTKESSPLVCGGAFRLLMRLTAGLTVAPWASLRGYKADCAELLASVGGEDADYEIALLQAVVTEKLPLAQLISDACEPVTEKQKRSLKRAFSAGIGIINQSQSLKFLLSSGIAFVIDTLLLVAIAPLLPWRADISEALAQTVAWVVSSLTNFTLNQRFVFRAKGRTLVAMGQYYSLAVFVMLGKQVLLYLFSTLLSLPLVIAKLVCEVAFFLFNYIVQKKLIFRRKKQKND